MLYKIFTDGGCRNTGNIQNQHVKATDKSAYAFLVTQNNNGLRYGTQGFYGKTNNQMEVYGVECALMYILFDTNINPKTNQFIIVSDSKYVDNAINSGWLQKWFNQNYKNRKNAIQWNTLLLILVRFDNLKFEWTKGHSTGNTFNSKGNIFVDHLLNKTMDHM